MRTSFIAASLGAAVLTLATNVGPGQAQSAAELYPFCAFRSGSTSCYFMTRESCGHSCIANPAYVGEDRARARRATIGGPAIADRERARAQATRGRTPTNTPSASRAGTSAPSAVGAGD